VGVSFFRTEKFAPATKPEKTGKVDSFGKRGFRLDVITKPKTSAQK